MTIQTSLHVAGEWQEELDSREQAGLFNDAGHSERPLPLLTIRRYAQAAVRRHEAKQYDDGNWYLEVPGLHGVWAEAMTIEAAKSELEDVVFEWALLKIDDRDRDIPPLDGINLNSI